MKKFLKLAVAITVAALFSSVTFADNQGISIGVWGSQNDIDTYGSETEKNINNTNASEVVSASKSERADVASIFVEFTSEQGSAIGFEYYPGDASIGSGTRTDTCTCGAAAGTSSKTYTASADVSHLATMYVEPAFMFTDTMGVYGKVGASTMHVESIHSIAHGTDSSYYPDTDVWGITYGAGFKYRTPVGLFFKLEASWTNFATINLQSDTGNKNEIEADIDVEAVRLGVGYTF